jgi:hypothetical protein
MVESRGVIPLIVAALFFALACAVCFGLISLVLRAVFP